MSALKIIPGTVVHIIPGTTLHALLGDTAVVGKGQELAADDPEYIALLDPVLRLPRICLRDYVVECQPT